MPLYPFLLFAPSQKSSSALNSTMVDSCAVNFSFTNFFYFHICLWQESHLSLKVFAFPRMGVAVGVSSGRSVCDISLAIVARSLNRSRDWLFAAISIRMFPLKSRRNIYLHSQGSCVAFEEKK